ncbi:hypothetical protein EQ875_01705 [Photobacterium damselae subsp. damselae]|nr:hypothetical protein EQ875_01705 [Photobacterium damselae subsp. damselae]
MQKLIAYMNGELVGTLEKHKNGAHTFQYDKNLPDAIYLHKDAFSSLPDNLKQFIPAVAKAIKLEDEQWDLLVKLYKKEFRLSFLSYPTFYSESYPPLKQSVIVDLVKLTHKRTDYCKSENPPILH